MSQSLVRGAFVRKLALVAAGSSLLQVTACFGPDPAGFFEDTFVGAFVSTVFAVVFETLTLGAA
jgi:hypothetical protein